MQQSYNRCEEMLTYSHASPQQFRAFERPHPFYTREHECQKYVLTHLVSWLSPLQS